MAAAGTLGSLPFAHHGLLESRISVSKDGMDGLAEQHSAPATSTLGSRSSVEEEETVVAAVDRALTLP